MQVPILGLTTDIRPIAFSTLLRLLNPQSWSQKLSRESPLNFWKVEGLGPRGCHLILSRLTFLKTETNQYIPQVLTLS